MSTEPTAIDPALLDRWRELRSAVATPEWPAAVTRATGDLGPDQVPTLKSLLRARAAGPHGLDPWLLETALQRSGVAAREKIRPHALWRASWPERGVREPERHLRILAIARTIQLAFQNGAPDRVDAIPDLAGVGGAREVWWWMTGAALAPLRPHDLRRVVVLAAAVHRVLGPLGLLAPDALAARRAQLDTWEALWLEHEQSEEAHDLLRAEHRRCAIAEEPAIEQARSAVVEAIAGEPRPALDRALRLLSELSLREPPRAPIAALAAWCAEAQIAAMIGGAAPLRDSKVLAYVDRLARRLAGSLATLLESQPLSLLHRPVDFEIWYAVSLVVRDRLDAGQDAEAESLLRIMAETGSWTGSVGAPIAAIARMLVPDDPREASRLDTLRHRFVLRLAMTTAERRQLTLATLWKPFLRRHADLVPHDREWLKRWFAPNAGGAEPSRDEAHALTIDLAGPDLDAPDRALAWWDRLARRGLLTADEGACGIVRVPAALAATATATATPPPEPTAAGTGMSLQIALFEGQNGELYFVPRLFGVRGGRVSTLVEDGALPVPVSQTRRIDEVRQAVSDLRDAARLGRAGRPDIEAVQQAIASLASAQFWTDLGGALGDAAAALELSAADGAIPWELAATEEGVTLGQRTPLYRRRGATWTAPSSSRRRALLLVVDPDHPGASEEVAAIEDVWQGSERTVVIVDTVADLRTRLGRDAFDVVHYAGHQGPADDTTPSLALRDERLPARDLADLLHARPPELLFLNACSTLAPTRRIATGDGDRSYTAIGPLEPLSRSRVPVLVGTLWDIVRPDALFVRTFYERAVLGASWIDALHAARVASSRSRKWAGIWPAYVMLAPGP